MTLTQKLVRIDPLTAVLDQLHKIASSATPEDKALVAKITERAKAGKGGHDSFTLSPTACALLFVEENGHNRDFVYPHALELKRRMLNGQWKRNNATIGFYVDGEISDGQHRTAAAALAGFTLHEYLVVFGMERDSIDTVDSPKVRDGASHAKLDGIKDASAKQAIVRSFSTYMVRFGQASFDLRSASEIKQTIEDNDPLLDASIRLGAESVKGILSPVFKPPMAANLAYTMLKNGWPEQRIREKLSLFQNGDSQDGENSPFFVAGSIIEKARAASKAKDRLTPIKELGVAILAMIQTEQGIKATKEKTIKAEINGKTVPNPQYPGPLLEPSLETLPPAMLPPAMRTNGVYVE